MNVHGISDAIGVGVEIGAGAAAAAACPAACGACLIFAAIVAVKAFVSDAKGIYEIH